MENLGAYGIDADMLGHRALEQDSSAYRKVIDTYGAQILTIDGKIDRSLLAKIVFSNSQALVQLEGILHPLIRQAINLLIDHATQDVIVIEAIKLLEGELRGLCDSIWVSDASIETQHHRLAKNRKMKDEDAWQRIKVQMPQQEKIDLADVVINNDGDILSTWHQVSFAWNALHLPKQSISKKLTHHPPYSIRTDSPDNADEIAHFISICNTINNPIDSLHILNEFTKKAFLSLRIDDKIEGLAGWSVENLITRVDDIHISPHAELLEVLHLLIEEVENVSRDFQCEAVLLFVKPDDVLKTIEWEDLGYRTRDIGELDVQAWQEAAYPYVFNNMRMLFKQISQGQVFRGRDLYALAE